MARGHELPLASLCSRKVELEKPAVTSQVIADSRVMKSDREREVFECSWERRYVAKSSIPPSHDVNDYSGHRHKSSSV